MTLRVLFDSNTERVLLSQLEVDTWLAISGFDESQLRREKACADTSLKRPINQPIQRARERERKFLFYFFFYKCLKRQIDCLINFLCMSCVSMVVLLIYILCKSSG